MKWLTKDAKKREIFSFDYVIDCRGWPENYDDYVISKTAPLNSCLVQMVPEPGDWNFTYHIAHENGWMFGIPLKTRQGWGYLYNDTITTREEAETHMKRFQQGIQNGLIPLKR